MNLDALLEPIETKPKQLCKVGRILDQLENPYKTALFGLIETKVADGGLSDDALAARMKTAGIAVGAKSIWTHRRRLCACPAETMIEVNA